MRTKISPYWRAFHKEARDVDVIKGWNPPVIKLEMDHWRSFQLMEELLASTTSLLWLRDHPMSEQHQPPNGDWALLGRLHAERWNREWHEYLKNIKGMDVHRLVFMGRNEPGVATRDQHGNPVPRPNAADHTATYTVSYLDTLRMFGLYGSGLNLSVGWPDNTGPDTAVDWSPFAEVKNAIVRGNHYLAVHEYWGPEGPLVNQGWWADRLGQCPWDVKILVGECGIDHGVIDGNLIGWKEYVDKITYMHQLQQYDQMLLADRRVVGACIFSYDFEGRWWHFDVRELREELLQHSWGDHHVPAKPFPRYAAAVQPPSEEVPVSRTDNLVTILKQRGIRYVDLRGKLRVNPDPNIKFSYMDSFRVPDIAIHHSAGSATGTVEGIAEYHVDHNGWAGIGYHLCVRQGVVYIVAELDSMRAHVAGKNDTAIGICVLGTYTSTVPTAGSMMALRQLIGALDELYAHKKALKGHVEINGTSHTTCPGAALLALVPTLRNPVVRKDKVRWASEEAARILQREGLIAEHDFIIAKVLPFIEANI